MVFNFGGKLSGRNSIMVFTIHNSRICLTIDFSDHVKYIGTYVKTFEHEMYQN